jgi:hypothetical protein
MFGRETEVEYAAYVESELSDIEYELLTAQQRAEHVDQAEVEPIPSGLEKMTPGPYLAAILSGIDRTLLRGHDVVTLLQAEARLAAHYQAAVYATMNEVAHCASAEDTGRVEEAVEFAADEVRAALRLTRRAAETEMDLAWRLRIRLPQVWKALHSGAIDLRRARTIAYGTDHLPTGTAQHVVDAVIGDAPKLTTGQLAARIRRLCVETDPDDAKTRYREGLADRRVVSEANPDGTGNIHGLQLPPDRMTAVSKRINQLARTLKTRGETRTLDQIRADVFLDILEGRDLKTGSGGGTVDIHVDLATLAGIEDHAAEMNGFGPVIADIARQVAKDQAQSKWQVTVTDSEDGTPVWQGTTRRRPTAAQKRLIESQNRTCIFPGCRMPARDCDLDHTRAVADGGHNSVENQAPLCRHDHIVKHGGWHLRRTPDGRYIWTSRLGHTYTTSGTPP